MIWQLMWKEGREHQWKIVASLLLLLVPLAMLQPRSPEADAMYGILFIASWVAAIWIAASTATSERSGKTLSTLTSLPAPTFQIFAVKTAFGAATVLAPVGIALAIELWLIGDNWSTGRMLIFESVLLCALNLYLLILVVTVGIRKEGLAAMIGVVVFLVCGLWFLVVVLLQDFLSGTAGWELLGNCSVSTLIDLQ